MLYGQDPQLPTDEALTKPTERCYLEVDDYRSELVQNLSEAWKRAQKNVKKAQKKQQKHRDKRVCMVRVRFAVGDRVCQQALY